MFIRLLIVYILFLALPLIGVFFEIFGEYNLLTQWDYLNVILSISFTFSYALSSFNISKVLGGLLFFSILLQQINNYFLASERGSVFLIITLVLYKFLLAVIFYHFLFNKMQIEKILRDRRNAEINR